MVSFDQIILNRKIKTSIYLLERMRKFFFSQKLFFYLQKNKTRLQFSAI
jgi:hypothetical protein